MAKIPFDIAYRPQIESGEYKVVDVIGHSVRIVCWDRKNEYSIVGIRSLDMGKELRPSLYSNSGVCSTGYRGEDLYIITPEPELTEFEEAVEATMTMGYSDGGKQPMCDEVRSQAKLLLDIVRKQFDKTQDFGVSNDYDRGYAHDHRDALKDMPKWRKYYGEDKGSFVHGDFFTRNGYIISLEALDKLPKEE